MVTSDNTACSTTLIIKPSPTLDLNIDYYAAIEINVADLEKILCSLLLVTERTLFTLGKKEQQHTGRRYYLP